MAFDTQTYLLIPFLIFLARIIDVSLGTLRLIFVSKGYKKIAPVLGFFEVMIWLFAIRNILMNLSNFNSYLGYGLGFAAGTYAGIILEEKISLGKVLVRIITKKEATELIKKLRQTLYTVTTVNAKTKKGRVKLIYIVIKRHDIHKIATIIEQYDGNPFYTVEDIRYEHEAGHKICPKKRLLDKLNFLKTK